MAQSLTETLDMNGCRRADCGQRDGSSSKSRPSTLLAQSSTTDRYALIASERRRFRSELPPDRSIQPHKGITSRAVAVRDTDLVRGHSWTIRPTLPYRRKCVLTSCNPAITQ